MIITIPASVGELADKLGILKIKLARIADPAKLANITREHNLLYKIYEDVHTTIPAHQRPQLIGSLIKLKQINEKIWDIEDSIRDCERRHDFGDEFIILARGVYINNDARAALKREINDLVGSTVIEEKSYTDYACHEKIDGNGQCVPERRLP